MCWRGSGALRFLVAAAVVVLAVVGGCGDAPVDAAAEPAPEFELSSLDGELVRSSAYAGDVMVLEFWATWCTPCVAQARILEPLHREFAPRGVEFLAISLGEARETVRSYVERSPFPYPVLIDPEDELSGRLGIFALPTVMVIDGSGSVVYQQPGLSSGEVLRRVLEDALG